MHPIRNHGAILKSPYASQANGSRERAAPQAHGDSVGIEGSRGDAAPSLKKLSFSEVSAPPSRLTRLKGLLLSGIAVLGAFGPLVASSLVAGTAYAAESLSTTLPRADTKQDARPAAQPDTKQDAAPAADTAAEKRDIFDGIRDAGDSVGKKLQGVGEFVDRSVVSPVIAPIDGVRKAVKSQIDTEKDIGDYHLKVDSLNVNIGLTHHGNPLKGVSLGVKVDHAPIEMRLSKTEQAGNGWTASQGIAGSVRGRFETGVKSGAAQGADLYDGNSLEGRLEAFKSWQTAVGDYGHLTLGITPIGISHDFIRGQSVLFTGANQELTGKSVPYLGENTGWKTAAKEGFHHNLSTGKSTAYYEVSAGVTKKIPLEKVTSFLGVTGTAKKLWMSDKAAVELEAGYRVMGNSDRPFDSGPYTGARIKW